MHAYLIDGVVYITTRIGWASFNLQDWVSDGLIEVGIVALCVWFGWCEIELWWPRKKK